MNRPTIFVLKLLQVPALFVLGALAVSLFLGRLLVVGLEFLLDLFHDFIHLPLEEATNSPTNANPTKS